MSNLRSVATVPLRPFPGWRGDRPALRVVPRRRTRAPRVPFVTLVTLLLVGGVVGLLLFNTSMQQASFATTSLDRQATALGLRQQTLVLQLERMRDPQRLATRARRLGMVSTSAPVFLDLRSGRVLGDAAPAGRVDRLRLEPYPLGRPEELTPETIVVKVLGERLSNSPADTSRASTAAASSAGRNE